MSASGPGGPPPLPPEAGPPGPVPPAREAAPGRRERVAETMGAWRLRATDAYANVEARRSSNPLIDTGFRLGEHNRAVGGAVLAGAVAFRIFLFMVPFVFVFVVTLGSYASISSVEDAADVGGISGLATRMMKDTSQGSHGLRITALLAGLLALVLAAHGLAKVLRITHALAWRCELNRPNRVWAPSGTVVGFTLITLLVVRLLKVARDDLGPVGTGITLLAVVAFAAAWLWISLFLPRAEGTRWTDLLPGAALVGIGVQALQIATVYWFSGRVSSLSERYGAVGVAVGMLSWAYAVGWLTVSSAVLNAVVWERFGRPRRSERARGRRDLGADPL